MKKRIALISTGVGVVSTITAIVNELNPELDIINFVDDSVIRSIAANGNVIPPSVVRRLSSYFVFAEEIGAIGALLTCSSVNEIVDTATKLVKIPCFKIDQPMADYAINIGTRIGVAATLETTLEPTKRLLISRASFASKNIQIDDRLCDGAFDALQEGDNIKHDEIVSKAIKDLAQNNDVVVLAQASMARTVESLPGNLREKVLSSPRLGIYAALQALELI